MAQPLALANISWAEYSAPIRLPHEDGGIDSSEDDANDAGAPNPLPPPSLPMDDDDGTCLLDLFQRCDPLADLLICMSLNIDAPALVSISELLNRDQCDTSLVISNLQGLPVHSILLLRSQGAKFSSQIHNQIIDIRHDKEPISGDELDPRLMLKQLPSILSESYGGPGYRKSTREYLLQIYDTNHKTDGVIKCGFETYPIHQFMLSHRSDFFRAAFAHSQKNEPKGETDGAEEIQSENRGNIAYMGPVIEIPVDYCSKPGMLDRLLKYCYTQHRIERDALLSPEWVADVAFSADILMLPDLKEAALSCMCEAVDSTNAPSLLYVAEHLNHDTLRRKCIGHMVKHLGEVARAAPNFSHFVGGKEYEWLERLAEASKSNPVACGVILTDEREYIGMLSEALDAQRTQYCVSMSRQAEEMEDFEKQVLRANQAQEKADSKDKEGTVFHDIANRLNIEVEKRRRRLQLVEDSLVAQSRHIEFVSGFLKAAASASASACLSSTTSDLMEVDPPPRINEDVPLLFVPTYEWQNIQEHQQIPAGLEIMVNIGAGFGGNLNHSLGNSRRARIPPVWRLKLWIEWINEEDNQASDVLDELASQPTRSHFSKGIDHYFRQDVKSDDTIGDVERAIARIEAVESQYVNILIFDEPTNRTFRLDPATTFAPHLFIRQRDLRVAIGRRLQSSFPEVHFSEGIVLSNSCEAAIP